MRVLITGLCGFIGHHVAEHLLRFPGIDVVGIDRLDATSTLHRLRYIDGWTEKSSRVSFVWHDLRAPVNDLVLAAITRHGRIDVLLHLAASTHVERSIYDAWAFVQDNVVGTLNVLELARRLEPELLVYFSTDEVFGPAPAGVTYTEWDRTRPGNPYAATKSAGEELTISYENTYGLRAIVTHCMNVVGPRQHPEKYLPKAAGCLLRGESVPVHVDREGKPGSRVYLSAYRVARALKFLIDKRSVLTMGDKFNLVGEREVNNLEMARIIAFYAGRELQYEPVDFHSTRPGHDLRYALDGSKLAALGFEPPRDLDRAIEHAVQFCLKHREWS